MRIRGDFICRFLLTIWISVWFLVGRKRKINVEKRTSGTQGRQETAGGGHDIFSQTLWIDFSRINLTFSALSRAIFSSPTHCLCEVHMSTWFHLVPRLHLGLWELILLQGVYLISLLAVATVSLSSIFPRCPRSLRELSGEPWIELSLLDVVQSLLLQFFLRWSSP